MDTRTIQPPATISIQAAIAAAIGAHALGLMGWSKSAQDLERAEFAWGLAGDKAIDAIAAGQSIAAAIDEHFGAYAPLRDRVRRVLVDAGYGVD